MSQTLLIHDNSPLIDILKLNLLVYVGTDVIIKKNFKESRILMEHHPGIDLIICADSVEGESTAELAFEFYQKLKRPIPFIVTGTKAKLPLSEKVVFLDDTDLQQLLQMAAKFLKITPREMVEKIVPDFFPINTTYGLNLLRAPCPIFIETNGRYIQKYITDQQILSDEIIKLLEDGHTSLFVEASDRLKIVNEVTASLTSVLTDQTTDPRMKISATEKSLQILESEALKDEYIEMSVKVLAISAIKTCMEIAKHSPRVATLLKDLLSNRASYRFKHIQLNIYICNHIVSRIDWGSSEVKEKLAFVCFFHDICLTDDKLARITGETFKKARETLTKEEIELVEKHAQQAAEIVQKLPIAPMGSDAIILQHHGMLRGIGFSDNYAGDLSPLAMIFIVAEELGHMIIDNADVDNMNLKKDDMIADLYRKFPRSKFAKIIETLKSLAF